MNTPHPYEFNSDTPLLSEGYLDLCPISCPACHFKQPADWDGEPTNFCINCAEPLQILICQECEHHGTHEEQALFHAGNYCPWCAAPVIKPADQA